MQSNKKPVRLIILLATLAAFAPMSTDIYLPSLPTLKAIFNTSAANVQLTLSLFFVAYAIMQLVWGPLSDRLGRKAVTLSGLAIFLISSLGCALAPNIETLIVARLFQAIGACAGIVMAFAMTRDTFSDEQLAGVLSIVITINALAPVIAPIIGSNLLSAFNWQAPFYFLCIYAFILLIACSLKSETHPAENRKPLPARQLWHANLEQLLNKPFLLAMLAVSVSFCSLFAFISSSSFIYISIYHTSANTYGGLFALNACGLMLGTFFLAKIKRHLSHTYITPAALGLMLIGALLMLMMIALAPHSIWSIAIPNLISTVGFGIIFPEMTAFAMQNIVAYTGIASSLLGSCRFIMASIIAYLMGFIIHNNAYPLAITMLCCTMLTGIFLYLLKNSSQQAQKKA